jgi:hypothetical protein
MGHFGVSKQTPAMTSSERQKPRTALPRSVFVVSCGAALVASICASTPAFAAGQLPDAPGPTTSSPKVETNQASATEVSDSLWYLRLGAGGVVASGLKGGPSFGSGFRYNWDSYGFDASIFNFTLTKNGSSFDDPAGPWIKLALLKFADPFGQSSFYYGAGIGWGTTQANIDDVSFSNSGVNIGLTAGIELHRASVLRYLIQFDADLPTYAAHGIVPGFLSVTPTFTQESHYIPSFVLSFGVAFGTARAMPQAAPPPGT